MADAESEADQETESWYNEDFMPYVRGYWIYATVVIALNILYIPWTAKAASFKQID